MRLRIVLWVTMWFPVLGAAGALAAESSLPVENLAGLVETALANNPELKASQARWQMFANRARQASSFEDPMLMLKLQNALERDPLAFDRDPQTARVVGISQQIPFWGKRAFRQEVAEYEAESYRWQVAERRLELTRMVKETYYQLYGVDKALAITGENLRLLADLVKVAESRYAVGQGMQQEVYKAGLQRAGMLDMQISLQQQRKSLEATLNALLYRPGTTPVGGIADFALPKVALSAGQLNELALAQRPQLQSLTMLTNKGKAARRLAQREYYPDFNLSFEYMFREESMNDPGYNMVSAAVTFNLPFQQERRRAMLDESAAETTMATEELNALKNTMALAINDTLAQMERRQRLVELYRGAIIPQAEHAMESALISYRVNKGDFFTVLDSRMALFAYQRELADSLAEYMIKLAQLEATVGGELPLPSPAEPAHHHH